MANFAENLKSLPPVAHLARLELFREGDPLPVASIENRPGQAGSLAVYHHLVRLHGAIDAAAAQEGLDLYAEHTADARVHPGKHPNIDRLLSLVAEGGRLVAKEVPAA
ncbi:MAG: DUF2322 family protein [Betaproteobacteria bacterium]|jgi:hypothetical protein